MTRAGKQLISLESTPYYHCISRCIRRAFLCSEDSLTGKNYEHRKRWVIEHLRELAGIFSIYFALRLQEFSHIRSGFQIKRA